MSEQNETTEFGKSEQIEHLGLVAVLFKELGLEELVNQILPFNYEKVSPGKRLLAMILNALGFVDRPLYLTPHFLEHLHLTRLIGPDLKPEFFNDDNLGRFLDQIYKFGPENFFQIMSFHVLEKINYDISELTLDATSVSLFACRPAAEDDKSTSSGLLLKKGYSKDHRPDLNQFVLNLVCTGAEGLPCAIQVLPGDSNDKTSFPETIAKVTESFQKNFDLKDHIWIGDSALHSEIMLDLAEELNFQWITRVPHTNSSVQEEIKKASRKNKKDWKKYNPDDNYSFYETTLTLKKHKYRALMIKSESLRALKLQTFAKNLKKREKSVEKEVSSLEKKLFNCKEDARKAFAEIKNLDPFFFVRLSQIKKVEGYEKPGRPKKSEKKAFKGFQLKMMVRNNKNAIAREEAKMGVFALGTNLSAETHSPEDLFQSYKKLNKNEQGFKFLKDSHFFCDHIYLKNDHRIHALMAVMSLALLFYGVIQFKIRKGCKEKNVEIPNFAGKKTQRPTARLCFSYFRGISVMIVDGEKPRLIFSKLNLVVQTILHLLGPPYVQIYQP